MKTRALALVIAATTATGCKAKDEPEPEKLPVPTTTPDDASRPVTWPFDAAPPVALDAATTAPLTGTLTVTAALDDAAVDAAARTRWLARFARDYAPALLRCDHFAIPPGDVRLVLDVDAQGLVTRTGSPDRVDGLACLTAVATAFRFDARAAAGQVTVTLHLGRR